MATETAAIPTASPARANRLNIASLKAFNFDPRVRAARRNVLACRATARTTRAKVDAYLVPLFLSFGFVHDETGAPLTRSGDLYLSGQAELVEKYYVASDVANREHGFNLPAGHCPALTAEHAVIKAERALLDLAEEHLGVDFNSTAMDIRADALDLFLNPPTR